MSLKFEHLNLCGILILLERMEIDIRRHVVKVRLSLPNLWPVTAGVVRLAFAAFRLLHAALAEFAACFRFSVCSLLQSVVFATHTSID